METPANGGAHLIAITMAPVIGPCRTLNFCCLFIVGALGRPTSTTADSGLLQITNSGEWTHVKMKSASIPGSRCNIHRSQYDAVSDSNAVFTELRCATPCRFINQASLMYNIIIDEADLQCVGMLTLLDPKLLFSRHVTRNCTCL